MACEWTVHVSGYLDNELEEAERKQFEAHLLQCGECAAELASLRSVREVTDSMKLVEFPDEAWERYWRNTYPRFERNTGWILLSIGAIILLTYGTYELALDLLQDTTSPWWIRMATGLVCAGISVLFVSVLRERLFVRKSDPYREVKR